MSLKEDMYNLTVKCYGKKVVKGFKHYYRLAKRLIRYRAKNGLYSCTIDLDGYTLSDTLRDEIKALLIGKLTLDGFKVKKGAINTILTIYWGAD